MARAWGVDIESGMLCREPCSRLVCFNHQFTQERLVVTCPSRCHQPVRCDGNCGKVHICTFCEFHESVNEAPVPPRTVLPLEESVNLWMNAMITIADRNEDADDMLLLQQCDKIQQQNRDSHAARVPASSPQPRHVRSPPPKPPRAAGSVSAWSPAPPPMRCTESSASIPMQRSGPYDPHGARPKWGYAAKIGFHAVRPEPMGTNACSSERAVASCVLEKSF